MGKSPKECYLEYVKLTSFGAFSNRVVGPFKPGLNVVYGTNEAGKTTLSQLVRGVLFGWPRNSANANSYKPEVAERAGSLFFADASTHESAELRRIKNSDALNDDFGVLSDIDAGTYDTMFSLTSDELMDLKSHDEVIAHLLTAGSGTAASPASASAQIDDEIRNCLSKSKNQPRSIANLRTAEQHQRDKVREGQVQAEAYLADQRQLEELAFRLDTLTEAESSLAGELDSLKELRSRLVSLDERSKSATEALNEARRQRTEAQESAFAEVDPDLDALLKLSQVQVYQLEEGLNEQQRELERTEHAISAARANETASRVAYEAISRDPDFREERASAGRQRKVKLVLAVLVPLLMVLASAFMLYRALNQSSFTMLFMAASLLVGSLFVCGAGFAMNFRPSRVEEEMSDRLKKAEWVMRQDALMLEECERAHAEQRAKVATFLSANHLAQAAGSVSQARVLLDRVRKAQAQAEANNQIVHALDLQIASLEKEIDSLAAHRREICLSIGLAPCSELEEVDKIINGKLEERTRMISLVSQTSHRQGQLKQELTQALGDWDFEKDKLELNRLQTCLKDAQDRLTSLLIARMALSQAIADWEKMSQPEVYRHASELLSLMTDGAWCRVYMDSDGEIRVMDAVRTARDPRLLSTGTRQQLYLALRIALLITADAVGKHIPVLCDDILVNFDSRRRKGAIKALAELARRRQVILFTCHAGVVKQVSRLVPEANHIEL